MLGSTNSTRFFHASASGPVDAAPEAARLYVMANITAIDVPAQGEQTLTTT